MVKCNNNYREYLLQRVESSCGTNSLMCSDTLILVVDIIMLLPNECGFAIGVGFS